MSYYLPRRLNWLIVALICSLAPIARAQMSVVYQGSPLVDPMGIAISPDGTTLYASDFYSGTIWKYPVIGGTPPTRLATVNGDFRGLAISPDGSTLYVAAFAGDAVYRVRVSDGAVSLLCSGSPMSHPHGIATSPDGNTVYIADGAGGTVYRVPASGGTPTIVWSGSPWGSSPIGSTAYGPMDVRVSPDGATLYISASNSGLFSLPVSGGVRPKLLISGTSLGPVVVSKDSKLIYIQQGEPTWPTADNILTLTTDGHVVATTAMVHGVTGFMCVAPNTGALYIADAGFLNEYNTGPNYPASIFKMVINQAPTANAGQNRVVVSSTIPASVTLDGSGSSDPENDPLTYVWTGSFGTASGVAPTVSLPAGINTITLTVTDTALNSTSAQVIIGVGTGSDSSTTDALNQQIASLNAQIQQLNSQIDTLTAELKTCNDTDTALQAQVSSLTAQLNTAQQTITSLQAQNATLTTSNQSLQDQLSQANTQIAQLTSNLQAAQATNQTLQNQVSALQTQVATDQTTIANLNGQIASLTATNQSLQSQLAQANSQISSLQTQLAAANNQISTLQSNLAAATMQISNLTTQNNQLTAANQSLQTQLTQANAQIAQLTSDLQASQTANQNLQAQLGAANIQIASLTAQNAQLSATNQALSAQNSAMISQIQALNQFFATLFNNPTFQLPGSTPQQQLQNLVNAVQQLNHGQQQALYKNLGGK